MRVAELIEILQRCDGEARVMLANKHSIFNALPRDVRELTPGRARFVVIADHRLLDEGWAACEYSSTEMNALLKLSDDYLRDAQADEQSERGRVDCAFEAGYAALLSVLTRERRAAVEHPSAELLVSAAQMVGVDAEPGLSALHTRYAPDEQRQSLAEVLGWAQKVRGAVRGV